jgi:Rrf2 family protein
MLYLAKETKEEGQLFRAQEISEEQDIPPHYLKQILSRLRAAGLVRSIRGPAGGHGLSRIASDINVGEVIRCLEGQLTCVDPILDMPCAISVGPQHCVIKEFLLEVKARIETFLSETTLAQLAERQAHLVEREILVTPAWLRGPEVSPEP